MKLFPTYIRYDVEFEKGEGVWLTDRSGRRWLDFASGIGVTGLGHNHPRVRAALIRQAGQLWHLSNLFPHRLQERVAEALCRVSGMGAVFFCNSGAEANEAAIKLARRWAREAKVIAEPQILTFEGSFHGRTLATLTATGQEKVKRGFDPLPGGFRILPPENMDAVREATGAATAAVLLELVRGEGGVKPVDPGFVRELADWCREKRLLLMVDEVQTGIGRTGAWFAFQRYGITPDVITTAKGLGNGFPVGAMLAREELKPHLGPGSHGTTFGGNLLAMAAAGAVLEELEVSGLIGEVEAKSRLLRDGLRQVLSPYAEVIDVRGLGLMIGVELTVPVQPFIRELLHAGLVTLPAGETVLRLLPPLVVGETEIRQAVRIIGQVAEKRFGGKMEGLSEIREVVAK
ncbi:aspartate aminotransferase family protein [Staphylospora marina]|uniref:aspartate aminotransferase family protein n=1 Tax=Staphylospora marina TaxID=2490858 RepID=UPI000F5BB505|nr:aspartate aminotransferase family protein [Staphylospora marina]